MIVETGCSDCHGHFVEIYEDGTYLITNDLGFSIRRTMQDPCIKLGITGYYFEPEEGITIPMDVENADRFKQHMDERPGM